MLKRFPRVPAMGFAIVLALLSARAAYAQMPVYGSTYAHDPSRITKQGNTYYVFYTSQGIVEKTSTDLRNWTDVSPIFPGGPPAWTSNAVPGFTGFFWAPDVIYLNGTNYLYYAVSTFGSQVSAIGLVTTTNLATGPWIDQGAVIQSANGSSYNCIDPCPLVDTNGLMWLTFGSYWNGIYLMQLNPATGKRIAANSPLTRLAYNSSIEASFLYQHGGYYYLFVNWNTCCEGIDSTYNIRVGRSTIVTGPYLDRNGVNMVSSGLGQLAWSADGWPVFTNDWSAFYTFNVDAREHLGRYNGTLQNGAVITNEPARGNVLSLDGVSQYALLPDPVANASTFAGWVKWNGGVNWQRIFDFGDGTGTYFFLTPSASTGNMRFAITTGGTAAEQRIESSGPLPSNSWCHVAVTLDGSQGLLYLDGVPVATNSALTIRPWQTLARSNYLGHSQFPADPLFNGKIDSFRVFSRALSAAEIKDLAYAHPALAHRYSFTTNAWDSIGMAHGTLSGSAVVTNNALVLNGTTGTFVNLPGGLISGSSAVTVEFWATFGTNGNWARVFDFGNINAGLGNGIQYLFFSPHTVFGTQRMELSTNTTVTLEAAGKLDNRTVHVVCIVDPTNHYAAVYTNGVLEQTLTAAWPPLTSVSTAWSFIGHSLFSADAYLNATIDELRIYDGRLTPQEIAVNDQFGPDALALPVALVSSNSAAGLTLSWPSWAVGFAPQAVTNLAAGGWLPLTQTSALAGDQWSLTIPKTNAAIFYRLQR